MLGGGIEQDGEPSPGTISRTGYFSITGCASTSVDLLLRGLQFLPDCLWFGVLLALNIHSDSL